MAIIVPTAHHIITVSSSCNVGPLNNGTKLDSPNMPVTINALASHLA